MKPIWKTSENRIFVHNERAPLGSCFLSRYIVPVLFPEGCEKRRSEAMTIRALPQAG